MRHHLFKINRSFNDYYQLVFHTKIRSRGHLRSEIKLEKKEGRKHNKVKKDVSNDIDNDFSKRCKTTVFALRTLKDNL